MGFYCECVFACFVGVGMLPDVQVVWVMRVWILQIVEFALCGLCLFLQGLLLGFSGVFLVCVV